MKEYKVEKIVVEYEVGDILNITGCQFEIQSKHNGSKYDAVKGCEKIIILRADKLSSGAMLYRILSQHGKTTAIKEYDLVGAAFAGHIATFDNFFIKSQPQTSSNRQKEADIDCDDLEVIFSRRVYNSLYRKNGIKTFEQLIAMRDKGQIPNGIGPAGLCEIDEVINKRKEKRA